jgi:hydrophobe/amphiphile efflux-3 (HAE3) family protein
VAVRRTLVIAAALLVVAIACVTQLRPTPSQELLVSPDSDIGRAGQTLDRRFGVDPVVVTLSADLSQTLAAPNLLKLLDLEGRIARLRGVRAVYGPGTFLNQTIVQSEEVLKRELGKSGEEAFAEAEAARKAALAAGATPEAAERRADRVRKAALGDRIKDYEELLVRLGTVGLPGLANAAYVNTVVFGTGVEPKRRFRWLFPDAAHAIVIVRPDPGLGEDETLALGRRITTLTRSAKLDGIRTSVGGFPLLAAALERETRSEFLRLAPIAILAMALLLALTLRRRRGRFVPLALALGGPLLAAGLSWPLGLGLSVSTVAALPVVLGLALDFAVQLQARFWHERTTGLAPPAAALAARAAIGPTLCLAAGAMAAGFLTLLVTSVPLLDRLGGFLALGTLTSVAKVLLVGPALLALVDRGAVTALTLPRRWPLAGFAVRPGALAVVLGLAAGGLALSGGTHLESDLRSLSPSGVNELRGVEALQRDLGTSGQVRVAIRAADVTAPDVVTWMGQVRDRALATQPRLAPGPNLADLVAAGGTPTTIDRDAVDGVLRLLPRYFLDAVITRDRRVAELSFGIPLVSVAEQGEIVQDIRRATRGAPDGVAVTATGLLAAASASTDSLESTRPGLLLLAAALIAVILFAAWRDVTRIAIVLCPALLAAGLTSLLLLVIDLELSPLGAALEPLVLAVGLEFGMLLDMRYREARAAGHEPAAAREHTTREIVPAVMLSASTVAVGFGVLCASRMPLLSQLGWLVALELALCLLAAIVVVPALAERLDRNHIGGADIHIPLFAERLARRLRAAGARKVA